MAEPLPTRATTDSPSCSSKPQKAVPVCHAAVTGTRRAGATVAAKALEVGALAAPPTGEASAGQPSVEELDQRRAVLRGRLPMPAVVPQPARQHTHRPQGQSGGWLVAGHALSADPGPEPIRASQGRAPRNIDAITGLHCRQHPEQAWFPTIAEHIPQARTAGSTSSPGPTLRRGLLLRRPELGCRWSAPRDRHPAGEDAVIDRKPDELRFSPLPGRKPGTGTPSSRTTPTLRSWQTVSIMNAPLPEFLPKPCLGPWTRNGSFRPSSIADHASAPWAVSATRHRLPAARTPARLTRHLLADRRPRRKPLGQPNAVGPEPAAVQRRAGPSAASLATTSGRGATRLPVSAGLLMALKP